MDLLREYFIRVLPGVLLVLLFLQMLPKNFVEIRLVCYIFIFILFRDTMTPLNIWSFSPTFAIRFISDPFIVATLGLSSAGFVGWIQWSEPELSKLIVWFKGTKSLALGLGLLSGCIVAIPVLIYQRLLPNELKAPTVAASMIPSLILICFIGNFLEEMLFRGYFQGYLEKQISPITAALLSGIFFGVCHIFLAISVTHLGFAVLGFALYEGVIAGFVRMKAGVIASTITHGLAIFLLASGIIS